ncbi:MAG: aminoacyl-tRNA hydrolase [Thermoanaerobaculia bacterium]
MKLILGLGNPGERYRDTRHNVGFRVVEELARRRGARLERLECNALVAPDPGLALAQPQTYMNRSGYAARCLVERWGLAPEALLVIYDEVNLPLGRLRLRRAGSPAGHRGMESILESLQTDQVARLRCGVAGPDGPPAGEAIVDFVLSPFAPDEREAASAMVVRAADACEVWAAEGVEVAMNRFNG